MVVLEDGGMMTTNPNQYLQPDYLTPLPSSVSIQDYLFYFLTTKIFFQSSADYLSLVFISKLFIFMFLCYSWTRRKAR